MKRREFLINSAMAVGAAGAAWPGVGRAAQATKAAPAQAGAAKTDRIAIMVYSFQSVLKLPGRPSSPTRALDVIDVPAMFADRFKVHHVEMQHNYFESTDAAYFKDFLAVLIGCLSKLSLKSGNGIVLVVDGVAE